MTTRAKKRKRRKIKLEKTTISLLICGATECPISCSVSLYFFF
jgi:hypothetical protein